MLRIICGFVVLLISLACQPARNDVNELRLQCGDDAQPGFTYSRFVGPDSEQMAATDLAVFEFKDGRLGREMPLTRYACLVQTSQPVLVRSRDKNSRLAYLGPAQSGLISLTQDNQNLSIPCDGSTQVNQRFAPRMAESGRYGLQAFAIGIQAGALQMPLALQEGAPYFDVSALAEGRNAVTITWQNLFSEDKQSVPCNLDIDRTPPTVAIDPAVFTEPGRILPLASIQFSTSEPADIRYCLQAKVAGSCDEQRLSGNTLVAPAQGEWILRYHAVDGAGNRSKTTEQPFVIYNQDRINTIKRTAQLADLNVSIKNSLEAARLTLEAHSLSDQLETAPEKASIDRLVRNMYWNVGLNLHVQQKIALQDARHGLAVCKTKLAVYEGSGKLTVYDASGKKLWSAGITAGYESWDVVMKFSDDCKFLATAIGKPILWDESGKSSDLIPTNPGFAGEALEFSSDSNYLLLKGNAGNSLYSLREKQFIGGGFGGQATFLPGTPNIVVCSGWAALELGREPDHLESVFVLHPGPATETPTVRNIYDSPTNASCKAIVAASADDILLVQENTLVYLQKEKVTATINQSYRPRVKGKRWFVASSPEKFYLLEDDTATWKDVYVTSCFPQQQRCSPRIRMKDVQSLNGKAMQLFSDRLEHDGKSFKIAPDMEHLYLMENSAVIDSFDAVYLTAPWSDFDLFERASLLFEPENFMTKMNLVPSRDKTFLYPAEDGSETPMLKSVWDLTSPIQDYSSAEPPYSYMLVQGENRLYCAFALDKSHELRDCKTGSVLKVADRFIKGLDQLSFGAIKGQELSIYSYQDIQNPRQVIDLRPNSEFAIMHAYVVACDEACSVFPIGTEPYVLQEVRNLRDLAFYDDYLKYGATIIQVASGKTSPLQSATLMSGAYELGSRARPGNHLVLAGEGSLIVMNGFEVERESKISSKIIGAASRSYINDYFGIQLTTAGSSELNEIHDLQNQDMVIRWPVAVMKDDSWAHGMASLDEGVDGLLLYERNQVFKLSYDKEVLRKRLCRFVKNGLSAAELARLCPFTSEQ